MWAYAITQPDSLMLVDTGLATSADPILEAIRDLTGETPDVGAIVLTHYHDDHMGASAVLAQRTGAPILAHTLDAPVVRGEQPELEPQLTDREQTFFAQATAGVPVAPRANTVETLEDGDTIPGGGDWRVVHVPGHTPGSVALLSARESTLICGDAAAHINSSVIVGAFNAEPDKARASFKRLAALDFETAGFGHGPPILTGASTAFRDTARQLTGD